MEGIAIWDAVRDSQYIIPRKCCIAVAVCVCVRRHHSYCMYESIKWRGSNRTTYILTKKTLPAHFTIQASGRVMPMMARNDNVDGKWYFTSMAWLLPNAVSLAYLVRLSCFCGVFTLHLLRLCCR